MIHVIDLPIQIEALEFAIDRVNDLAPLPQGSVYLIHSPFLRDFAKEVSKRPDFLIAKTVDEVKGLLSGAKLCEKYSAGVYINPLNEQMVFGKDGQPVDYSRYAFVAVSGDYEGNLLTSIEWFRQIRNSCALAKTPFYFMGHGNWVCEDQMSEFHFGSESTPGFEEPEMHYYWMPDHPKCLDAVYY